MVFLCFLDLLCFYWLCIDICITEEAVTSSSLFRLASVWKERLSSADGCKGTGLKGAVFLVLKRVQWHSLLVPSFEVAVGTDHRDPW